MSIFQLHPRLQHDCFIVGNFGLSQLLMMNDNQYPWFILVPRRVEIKEIHQLEEADRQMLLTESCVLAKTMEQIYQPDKLNIAAIGNLVPQLHVHHVARYQTDKTWPAPIWGKLPAQPYTQQQAELQINRLRDALAENLLN